MKFRRTSLLFVFLALSAAILLGSLNRIQAEETGKLVVELHGSEKLPVIQDDFILVRVGNMNGDQTEIISPFTESDMNFDSLTDEKTSVSDRKKLLLEIAEDYNSIYLKNRDQVSVIEPVQKLDSQVIFTGIPGGAYLLTSSTRSESDYHPYSPTVILMPGRIDGQVESSYEIDMTAKRNLPVLEVQKVDEKGNPICKPFVFGVYRNAECTDLIESLRPEEGNSSVRYTFSEYGTVYIREIRAPEGYQLSDQVIRVEFNERGLSADGKQLTPEDGIARFAVSYKNSLPPANPPRPNRPPTSVNSQAMLYAALFGAALIAMSILYMQQHRNRRHEKQN